MGMTEKIREAVRRTMSERGITQEQIAQKLEVDQPAISRMLRRGGSGQVPRNWERLLEALGLELVVREKR